MFNVFFADPCRFIEILLDIRSIRRLWHVRRQRGMSAILNELSTGEGSLPIGLPPEIGSFDDVPIAGAVLVIDISLPRYDQDAGGRSSFLYLQILREMGYEVFFMPNDQLRREPYATLLEKMGVRVLAGRGFRCGGWKHWLKGKMGRITHVILHRPNVARRYLPVLRELGVHVLYFAHDLRSVRDARQYEISGDVFHLRESDYWESIERTIVAQVDRVYFFSDEEVRLVSSWEGGNKARAVPLFPIDFQHSIGLSHAQRSGLLFVGGFAHQPNRDAVLWFAREVFPLVRRALPDIEWRIVGREPPPEILALAGNGILVEGVVSELQLDSFYRTSRLVVAPLRFGAGVKGKVVEAMGQGIPVVTTAIGAEGIPDGEKSLCVCQSADDMVRQIIQVYQIASLWEERRKKVMQGVCQHFSRQTAISGLVEDLR